MKVTQLCVRADRMISCIQKKNRHMLYEKENNSKQLISAKNMTEESIDLEKKKN